MLQDRVFQLWLENQKFKSHEIGFATLSKGEEMQVKEIMKELVIVNSKTDIHNIPNQVRIFTGIKRLNTVFRFITFGYQLKVFTKLVCDVTWRLTLIYWSVIQ